MQYGLPLAEAVPLFAALLSLPLPADYAPLHVSPEQQKQQTLHALLTILLRIAAQQPVLFVMEDLHWVDPTTLELLSLLVDQGPTARILALFTFRPDFSPPWTGRAHLTQVTLPRLPRRQAAEMTGRVAHGKALPAEVVEQVVAKTDGVPLFVEELTKMVLESGLLQEREERYELTGPLPPLAIPATLHDSLMARLDRLAAVKGLAQLGATLGREFSYALLQAVSPWDEETLQRGLQQLVEAELLYQRGLPPQATYLFKHALIQDAAYQSLLRSTRQQHHQRIAQVLEARFPETVRDPARAAGASLYGGRPDGAGHPLLAAGRPAGPRTLGQSGSGRAPHERAGGARHPARHPRACPAGAGLADHPGPGVDGHQGLCGPGGVTRLRPGARALPAGGRDPAALPGAAGLVVLLPAPGGVTDGAGAGRAPPHPGPACRRPGAPPGGPLCPREHLELSGRVRCCPGPFCAGDRPLRPPAAPCPCLPLRAGPRGDVPSLCRRDPVVSGLSGPGPAAEPRGADAGPGAGASLQPGHRPVLCRLAPSVPPGVAPDPGAGRGTHSPRDRARVCALGSGGTIFRGWALAQRSPEPGPGQGQGEEGMAQMQQGLAAWRATGAEVFRPYGLALLAEASAKVGQHEAGLTLLAEALAVANDTGERRWEAELYRLKGELLLARAAEHDAEAETCFRQALDIARRQQAKSWELRAAMSLSRLWQRQGKRAEASELLAPVYGWFTEGFDTADLQEAKALLEELA